MIRYFLTIVSIVVQMTAIAQIPAHTPENIERYKKICREHIYKEMKGMYREPGGRYHILSLRQAATSTLTCCGIGIHGLVMLHSVRYSLKMEMKKTGHKP